MQRPPSRRKLDGVALLVVSEPYLLLGQSSVVLHFNSISRSAVSKRNDVAGPMFGDRGFQSQLIAAQFETQYFFQPDSVKPSS
jgi:hypothetical protein